MAIDFNISGIQTDLKLAQTRAAKGDTWLPRVSAQDISEILGTRVRYRSYTTGDTTRVTYVLHTYTEAQLQEMRKLGFVNHSDF